MYAKRFGFLLFTCQIIFIGSYEIQAPVTTTVPLIRVTTLPEGYVSSSDNQVAYKLHQESISWNEARERCVSEGAYLAITDTASKLARVINMREYWGTRWLHVGIYYSNTTNQWVRVDNNVPVANLPWLENNPDDNGDCADMWIGEEPGLINYSCEVQTEWYVCEIPIHGH